MRIIFIFISFNCCLFITSIAQVGLETKTNFDQLEGSSFAAIRQVDNRYDGVKGFPTLYQDFILGEVQTKNNRKLTGLINYNAQSDELWIKKAGQTVSVLASEITAFKFDSSKTKTAFNHFAFYSASKKSGYFCILVEGNKPLLCRIAKRMLKADFSGAYSTGARSDEFLTYIDFFTLDKDNHLSEIKQSKNAILSFYEDKKDQILEHLNTEKIDIKKQEDLIKLFAYINSLYK